MVLSSFKVGDWVQAKEEHEWYFNMRHVPKGALMQVLWSCAAVAVFPSEELLTLSCGLSVYSYRIRPAQNIQLQLF